jgi:hypothetical protein
MLHVHSRCAKRSRNSHENTFFSKKYINMQPHTSANFTRLKRLFQEPLVHFVLLAGLLFVGDWALSNFRDDRRTITITDAVREEARALFVSSMKREPTPKDLKLLTDRWVDNEVLYREGIALRLDKGDQSIRERVIFKALTLTQSGLNLPAINPQQLRDWYDAHSERYSVEERYTFLEAVVPGSPTNDTVEKLAQALNGKGSSDTDSSLQIFKERPRKNIVDAYGEDFLTALASSKPGTWLVLTGTAGKHLVRLENITPGVKVNFEDVSERVLADWKQETMGELTLKAIRDMGSKYRVQGLENAP